MNGGGFGILTSCPMLDNVDSLLFLLLRLVCVISRNLAMTGNS